jgi:hypothetical protein
MARRGGDGDTLVVSALPEPELFIIIYVIFILVPTIKASYATAARNGLDIFVGRCPAAVMLWAD